MTEERLQQLEALCEKGGGDWPIMDFDDETPAWYIDFVEEVSTALPEALAEVRRLRQCLEVLAESTKLSGTHHNSDLWSYIVGEALRVDPKESPFWQSDEEEKK